MNYQTSTIPRDGAFARKPGRDLPAGRIIPYDYVAEFPIKGVVGNLVQDVISISVEGLFYAVAISYGFDEERAAPLNLVTGTGSGRTPENPTTLGDLTLDNIPPDVLVEGFRLNPDLARVAVKGDSLDATLPFEVAKVFFQRLRKTENFNFLFSIVDTATGRELQNEPVHSVATLGRADGRRPFKMLPQPMVFMPRSTIRLQVEETMAGVSGRLFIVLQGYKILEADNRMEEELKRFTHFDPGKRIPVYDHVTGNYRTLGEAIQQDIPTTRIVPFDYVSTLDLEGIPGKLQEDEVPINVDGGYVTTAIGYSLETHDTNIQVLLGDDNDPENKQAKTINLRAIKLADIKPVQALLDGIRIHPLRVRFAFTSGGQLATVPRDMVSQPVIVNGRSDEKISRMFQRLNLPEEVRFRYSFNDSGTGRDLQNRPLLNIAGLGIANGDRPFKVFHKPIMFLPRSSIRIQVEEIFGRGRLYIVFQGYKILS